MIKNIYLLGFLFIISFIPFASYAESVTPRAVDINIEYPYYDSVKKYDITGPAWPNKESRTEENKGGSLFFNFLKRHLVPQLPPFNKLFAAQKSSLKIDEKSSQKYVDIYHITGCSTDYTYKLYDNFIPYDSSNSDVKDKINAKVRKVCRGARGYSGTDSGDVVVYEEPPINQLQTKGESSIEYKDGDKKVKYSIRDDSKAVLSITPKVPENICTQYARYLLNACADGAISFMVPGGFVISHSGVVTKMSGELENLVFKNNPTWAVTLKVDADTLTPQVDGNNVVIYNESPVSCGDIKVLGKKLNPDCTIKVTIREKEGFKYITPTISSSKYYKYSISVADSPVLVRSTDYSNLAGSIIPSVSASDDDGAVNLDSEGFVIVPKNDNVLPMSSDIEPSASPSSTPYSGYSSSVLDAVLRFFVI